VKIYENFNCQLAKLIAAMVSGEYSKEEAQENGIRPTIFRRLVGLGHVEFSTAKQQDAEEYIRHLFDKIEQNINGEISEHDNPVNAFRFLLVNRFEDEQSHCVRYTKREDVILSLPVPHEKCRMVGSFLKHYRIQTKDVTYFGGRHITVQ
jgi:ubiquitin carboxyl-terminal hydrolase 5/13